MWRSLAFLIFLVTGGTSVAAEMAATVMFAVGNVTVENAAGVRRLAVRGGQVMSGDTVDTGSDGRVQLRFLDDASLSLTPGSRFRIDEYRFSGTARADDRGFFSLLRGGLRTVTGLIGKQFRQHYRVKTAVATIGIRGTTYTARLGDEGLLVNTVQGLVEVCNDGGCVQIGPGETASAVSNEEKPLRHLQGERMPALPSETPAAPVAQPSVIPGASSPSAAVAPAPAVAPPASAPPPSAPPTPSAPPPPPPSAPPPPPTPSAPSAPPPAQTPSMSAPPSFAGPSQPN